MESENYFKDISAHISKIDFDMNQLTFNKLTKHIFLYRMSVFVFFTKENTKFFVLLKTKFI